MKTYPLTTIVALVACVLMACDNRWGDTLAGATECWEVSGYEGVGKLREFHSPYYDPYPHVTHRYLEIPDATQEYAGQVVDRHRDLIWRHPNVVGFGPSSFEDDDGSPLDVFGIQITVTEKVDQSVLPEADRIPSCLDGVPVQFVLGREGTILSYLEADTDVAP